MASCPARQRAHLRKCRRSEECRSEEAVIPITLSRQSVRHARSSCPGNECPTGETSRLSPSRKSGREDRAKSLNQKRCPSLRAAQSTAPSPPVACWGGVHALKAALVKDSVCSLEEAHLQLFLDRKSVV